MQPTPLSTLIDAAGGAAVGVRKPGAIVQRVVIDSRQATRGDLFCALPGTQQDGHQFVAEAIERGAVAAVVQQAWAAAQRKPAQLVVVADVLQALWNLAAWNRTQCDSLRIALTGSVGKTTTRHLLHTVLARRFSGIQSPHNYNNQLGVPLTLLELQPGHEFAVIEVGASRIGEITPLARLIEPEIGLLTAIAPAHLEGFGSLEGICRGKGELLEALPSSGFAVLNGDDPLVRRLAKRAPCRVILVGEDVHNDIVATRVKVNDRRLRFQVADRDYELPAIGRHHLNSALLSLAVAREIGLTEAEISAGFKAFVPVHSRCEKLSIGEWTVIDDTYNASPAAMLAACVTLRDWHAARRRVLVAGDMLELGEHAAAFHTQLGELVAECRFDRVLAVGEHADAVAAAARQHGVDAGCLACCRDFDTACVLLDCWLEPGDVILVKGSRGLRMERFIEHLRRRAAAAELEPANGVRAAA